MVVKSIVRLFGVPPFNIMGANMSHTANACLHQPGGPNFEWTLESSDDESSLGKTFHHCRREDTVIIFDWDDTLLSSSAIRSLQWSKVELLKLERRVTKILRAAMSLGETLIVTNGNRTWVEDSAKQFLPGLLPLLSQLEVVSARALYENEYPGDPFMWKRAAFEHLLLEVRNFPEADGPPSLNLVVLGDQHPEIHAAHHVAAKRVIGSTAVKALKFKECPSIDDLMGQLRHAEQILSSLVDEEDDWGRGIVCRSLRPVHSQPASSACGWECALQGKGPSSRVGEDAPGKQEHHKHFATGLKEIWQLFL